MNAHDKDTARHRARLFRNGRSQDEVLIARDEEGKLTLEPVKKKPSLLDVLATLEPLPEEDWLPEITDDDLLPLDDVKL